ncbi:hypothetical protein MAMP_02755 [Methylophaga aminisulfidivorans MP]|uniref:Uncharacterized protein n=1 Tax=Methylophaga aminisulfidivorans MP TaxID=1026882 RepID=F5SW40_9GAMM|nr:hypothetical protein [Methylophaga aminisulfidivorans]EGL55761.1 hypothetical protein MAMP_02755 [Methylophaga aminisulfidivorans MP]
MIIEHYQEFRELEEKGLKKQASKALRDFISSFENGREREEWVWEFLPTLQTNRHSRIRHEIFHELVYPILKSGYENNDFDSTLWLGKLAQNIYQAQQLHQELNWVSELSLYSKSHELDPNNDEARLLLLKALVSWLEYSEHEWPSGILYGNNGATFEQCEEISAEVQRVLKLDKEFAHSEFIKQYVKKLSEYRARFNK